ncbi:MAG: fibronectin type III domain-containing protein [Bacteroidota bacterium]
MKLTPLLFLTIITLTSHAQVARWKFENNANDATASAINGTNVGSPTYSSTDSREGTYSLTLNGSTTAIDFGNPSAVPGGTSARSISCWAKTSTTSGQHYIVSYGTATQYKSMSIGMNGTSLVAGAYNDEISVSTFWATNTWHHIVLTYDGTTAILYADGTQVASVAKSWNLTKNKVWVGHNVNGNWWWNGQVDDVAIYSSALTSTQVAALAAIPPTPTSPSATAASSTQLNLSWTDASSTETGFAIERSTTSGSGYTLLTTTAANATSYSDTGLSPSTPYYYRMRAVADNANSAYTSEFTGTTLISPPTAPTGLGASAASPSQINLTWTDASSTETGFEVERSTTSGSGFTLVTTTAANATSFNDTGLTATTTYYYRIRSVNAGGGSSYTSEASATTTSGGSINAPTSPAATALTGSTIKIDWTDASSNETGFEIQRSLTSGSGFSLVTTTAVNAVTFTDSGLTPSTTYYYRVRAVNATLQSSYTSEVNATTGAIPAVPTSLSATAASSYSINLTWTDASSNETGFEIEHSLSSSSGFTLVTTTAANATSYTDVSLTSNTTYYYRIRGVNSNGSSAYTSVANATTLPHVPDAPTGLTATNGSSKINLNWVDNATDELHYVLERSNTSGSGFTVLATLSPNIVSYSDTDITAGTPVYYRVKATNNDGSSTYSNQATATYSSDATEVATNLFVDGVGGVGVGTSTVPSGYRFAVKGKMIAEGIKLDLQMAWPDYVFGDNYKLRDLPSLRSYINQNKHLPGIPTESEVSKNGIDVGEINVKLVEKIEELSLYVIQMEERIKELEKEKEQSKSRTKHKK